MGAIGVGGMNPIRIQSMTTTLTKDVAATAAQAERLVRVGCEIVRITTPTPSDARCLGEIREILTSRGISVPLVADIHFSPQAAMVAADYADKVRINPGNYVDSRKFAVREYSDREYQDEVEHAAERFTPLVLKCRERGIAMRIGTNHGSLSDRIMNRFGDTPEGMVESALEFVRVCEALDYRDLILSMKASNPKVMIAAYRLLAARMQVEGMDYPFHLGVTEAGNGEDGRIKSAIGIGSLLEDGIGDTVRVSLTEEPEDEIPVARALADRYTQLFRSEAGKSAPQPVWDPFHYERSTAEPVSMAHISFGGGETIGVIGMIPTTLSDETHATATLLRWASPAGRRQPRPDAALVELETRNDLDALRTVRQKLAALPAARLPLIAAGHETGLACNASRQADALLVRLTDRAAATDVAVLSLEALAARIPVIVLSVVEDSVEAAVDRVLSASQILRNDGVPMILGLEADAAIAIRAYRLLRIRTVEHDLEAPVLLVAKSRHPEGSLDRLFDCAIPAGALLCDGMGDAIMLDAPGDTVALAFNVLQGAGARISRTDYVACPSCGRTLFDLQETTDRIKSRTSHLAGVKLAIMGCVVNGPGEMADADFGYVGGAPGKVNLYVGKECVEKGVPAEEADDRLIALIKSHGKWTEAEEDEAAEPEAVMVSE